MEISAHKTQQETENLENSHTERNSKSAGDEEQPKGKKWGQKKKHYGKNGMAKEGEV